MLSRRSFVILSLPFLIAGCGLSPEEKAKQEAQNAADALEVKTRQEKYDVYNAAQPFIVDKLTSPGSAKFEDFNDDAVKVLSPGVYGVSGYVDSQNGFGALLRSGWAIRMHKTGNTYQVDEIAVVPKE